MVYSLLGTEVDAAQLGRGERIKKAVDFDKWNGAPEAGIMASPPRYKMTKASAGPPPPGHKKRMMSGRDPYKRGGSILYLKSKAYRHLLAA